MKVEVGTALHMVRETMSQSTAVRAGMGFPFSLYFLKSREMLSLVNTENPLLTAYSRVINSATTNIEFQPEIIEITTAAQANEAHRRVGQLGNSLKYEALSIGKFLAEQKSTLAHGEWENWVKDNLEFTERTAQRYTALFRRREEIGWGDVLALTGAETEKRQALSDLENPLPSAVLPAPLPKVAPATTIPTTPTQAHKRLTKPSGKPKAKRQRPNSKLTIKDWNPLDHGYDEIEPGVFYPRHGRPLSDSKTDGNRVEVSTEEPKGKNSLPRVCVNIDGKIRFPGLPLLSYRGPKIKEDPLPVAGDAEYYYTCRQDDGTSFLAFDVSGSGNSGNTIGKAFPSNEVAQDLADELNANMVEVIARVIDEIEGR
jgi:hypothetical protein